jgi:hypothetical protein
MSPETHGYVSVSAYSRIYGLTRRTVQKLLDSHHLEGYRLSGIVDVVRVKNAPPDQHAGFRQIACQEKSAFHHAQV